MAIRSLLKARRYTPFSIENLEAGVLSKSDIIALVALLGNLQGLLSGLSIGTGAPATASGNLKGQYVDHIFTAANTLTTIAHGLNVVPVFAIPVFKDRACDIYDTNFGAGWGTNQIQLYSTVASAKVKLLLLS